MNTDAPDLADLLESWLVSLAAANRSKATLKTYRGSVNAYLRWGQQQQLHAVGLERRTVQQFLADMLEAGAMANTARVRYRTLRLFSAWLKAEDEISVDDLAGLPVPQVPLEALHPLDTQELAAMVKACAANGFADRRDLAILRLMTETGMRAGEAAALQVTDIDVVRGMANVTRGKGGKGRVVPFGPQTATALDRWIRIRRTHPLAAGPALWLGENGKSFSYNALYRRLCRRAQMAGISRFHPHLLRHTAATRWLAAGGTEGGLMSVAGWQSRSMLDRYVSASASERAAAESRRLDLGNF